MIKSIPLKQLYDKVKDFNYRNKSSVTPHDMNKLSPYIIKVSPNKKHITIDEELFDIARKQMLDMFKLTKQ